MGDDDARIALEQRPEAIQRLRGVLELPRDRARLARPRDGIAPQGNHDSFHHAPGSARS